MLKLCILGKDRRSIELRTLCEKEFEMVYYKEAEYIVCPIPFTRDNIYINDEELKIDELIFSMKKSGNQTLITGALNNTIEEKLKNNNIKYIDIMHSEEFVRKNALATAEGIIKIIMENTDTTIKDSNILVVGYRKNSTKISRFFI